MRVQILRSDVREGVARETGEPYRIVIYQCVFPEALEAGELVGNRTWPTYAPGTYEAVVGVGKGKDRRLTLVVKELKPIAAASPK